MHNIANFLAGEVNSQVYSEALLVYPNEAPLLSMLLQTGMTQETATRSFSWFDERLTARRTQVDNGGSAYDENTTQIVVDSVAPFEVNSVILFEATGEVALVTAINTGSKTLTVVRGVGSSIAAAAGSVANNAWISYIGMAATEGMGSPAGKASSKQKYDNGLQDFRKSCELSGWADRERTHTGPERGRLRLSKMREMWHDIEMALLFGQFDDNITGADGKRSTTMGGLREAIGSISEDENGTVTRAEFLDFQEMLFANGGSVRTGVCGPDYMRAVQDLFGGDLEPSAVPNVDLRVLAVETPFGRSEFMLDRAMKGEYAKDCIYFPVEDLTLIHGRSGGTFRDGLPHIEPDLQQNGVDAVVDEVRASLSLKWSTELHLGLHEGVTGAA